MVCCVYITLVYYILTSEVVVTSAAVAVAAGTAKAVADEQQVTTPLGQGELMLPEFPGGINCISFNLETLQCRWDTGLDQIFDVTLVSCGNLEDECPSSAHCDDEDIDLCCLSNGCCTWSGADYSCQFDDVHVLEFKPIGEQYYQYHYNLSTFDNLIPGAALNFQLVSSENCSVNVEWHIDPSIQEFTRNNGMYYHLDYRISGATEWLWNQSFLSNTTSLVSTQLEMPYPGQEYDLRIRLQAPTVLTVNETMWSKPAILQNINITAQVPWVSPVITAGSFEVSSTITGTPGRSIAISWKQLEAVQTNGPEFQYIVYITDIPNPTQYFTTKGYITLNDTDRNENYTFVISSQNAKGESNASSGPVIVSDEKTRPKQPKLRAVIKYWSAENNIIQTIQGRDNMLNTIYQLRWYPASPHEQSFTIFWCNDGEDRAGPCQGKVNWVSGISITSYNLSLFDLDIGSSDTAVRFAISSEDMDSSLSSGMSWASCITPISFSKYTNTTPIIQEVKTNPNNYMTTIVWSMDCLGWGGDVKALLLQWCNGNHNSREQCPQVENHTASDLYADEIVLSSFVAGSQYTLWMSAVYNNNRVSHPSPRKVYQVPKDNPSVGLIILATGLAILLIIAVVIGGIFIKRSLCKVYADLNTNPKLPRGLTTEYSLKG